jgi:hypothetical protein
LNKLKKNSTKSKKIKIKNQGKVVRLVEAFDEWDFFECGMGHINEH